MNAASRVALMTKLGEYIVSDDQRWKDVKEKAQYENAWFTPQFVEYQLKHISEEYLAQDKLERWIAGYSLPPENTNPRKVGIVMAGNIPLAGFHDFLAGFISGNHLLLKPSSKDFQLINGVVQYLGSLDPRIAEMVKLSDRLKGCDAYIATGSNNSSRYFDYYFAKYPHIIRRNRTSVAVLTGNETLQDLEALAEDVYLYFGLGCRNVTKLYVPRHFDFLPLLDSFKKYNWTFDFHKYKNNYDYQLAIMIINKMYYMTNGSILLQENKSLFSPISQLNYEYFDNLEVVKKSLEGHPDIQCIVGREYVPFGQAQKPALNDYADKADTLQFLLGL